jgi:hypothetical protein
MVHTVHAALFLRWPILLLRLQQSPWPDGSGDNAHISYIKAIAEGTLIAEAKRPPWAQNSNLHSRYQE